MKKKRTALICRVSTKSEEQKSSIEYQKDSLVKYIKGRDDLEFFESTDIFSDQFSGKTIDRKNTNFEKLMKSLGFKIVQSKDEFSIVKDPLIKPTYSYIVCKSSSRFSRSNWAGVSLIKLLQTHKIYIYFYDLGKDTSELDDNTLTMLGMIDSSLSHTMSYNSKNTFYYKNQTRQIMNKGRMFGYDIKRIDSKKYYVVMIDMYLHKSMGSKLIANEMNKQGFRTPPNGRPFEARDILLILKSRVYLGEQKYYIFDNEAEYKNTFNPTVKSDYIYKLDFEWLPCTYIEPIVSIEEFEAVQKVLDERVENHKGIIKGKRQPILIHTEKSRCGLCGYKFYSCGPADCKRGIDKKFRCSTNKATSKRPHCDSHTFYLSFLEEELEKRAKIFPETLRGLLTNFKKDLENLKIFLVLSIDLNESVDINKLEEEKENLKKDSKKLIMEAVKKDSAFGELIEDIQREYSEKIDALDEQISIYHNRVDLIKDFLGEVDFLIGSLIEKIVDIKDSYTSEEYFNMIDRYTIYPKKDKITTRTPNNVYFIFQTKIELEVLELLNHLYESSIIKLLGDDIITPIDENHFKVKKPTKKQKDRALELIESNSLYD